MKKLEKKRIKPFLADSKMINYIPTKEELKNVINPFRINEKVREKEN